MDSRDQAERAAPAQTIVIERREKAGIFRRFLWPAFVMLVLLILLGNLVARDAALPTKLDEKYVAGEISGPKVAIVQVDGVIMGPEVEHALKQVRQARDDDQVRAVVLRVDSPGGTVSGSDRIWREVASLRERGKPVVVSMGGMAASGGYYIAAPADHIFAEPTTLTGSIGVIIEFPKVYGLMDKVGVDFEAVTTGDWKDMGSPFKPMTDAERDRWRELIGDTYDRFVRVVAQGRKLPIDQVTGLANGKVYTAREALGLGLVNQIGYLDDALLKAQALAKLSGAKVVRYAKPLSLTDALMGLSARPPALELGPETLAKLQVPQMLLLAR